MPLLTRNLDDRHFQDIVDEAKRLIPVYCPEWTDHNVSDPGVALIELFAWMTDLLLYRVNQVPDKMYIKFLDMIGIRLTPPRPARAPVTFYLSAPQPNDLLIPADTEVATVRTETSEAIVFTTEADLTIRPPGQPLGAFSRNASRTGAAMWTRHDLRRFDLNEKVAMFPQTPDVGDAFYLAIEPDLSRHVLALVVDCEMAGGAGVDPKNPPWEWETWRGVLGRWGPCVVEYDSTLAFNQPGEIILRLPDIAPRTIEGLLDGRRLHWLRCRITESQKIKVSPDLQNLQLEARGGAVGARHAATVTNEVIGYSDGKPGQEFKLLNGDILARDPQRDYLIVEPPGGPAEQWQEVADFADSGPADRHFTLESLDGTLALGPALLQPNGSLWQFGAMPPQGSLLRFSRYQHGGGVGGNVPRHALSVLKSSIPYVARVTNWEAATGGLGAQTLDDAKLRAPQVLRTRTRAMTAEDYEHLAREVANVARACCLAPGAQPAAAGDPRPGQVTVLVLPRVDEAQGFIAPEKLTLSADLIAAVRAYLDERRPLGIGLDIRQPQYFYISVQATLRVARRSDEAMQVETRQRAEAELYRYLNPYVGGPEGAGWPFGRDLHPSELYGLLQRIPGIEFVEGIEIGVVEPGSAAKPQPVAPRLNVPRHGLVCSWTHRLSVKPVEG
jgi:predicted phage baseplate assembly protein